MSAKAASASAPPVSRAPSRAGWRRGWGPIADFAGLRTEATYLWPRWLVLRAVGLVYVVVFAGVLRYSQALVGPNGITPLQAFFEQLKAGEPSRFKDWLIAPSVFWLGHGATAITVAGWAGMLAAIALVLNLWPRAALLACWALFISFTSTWRMFSPAQLDSLMIEVALICVWWAPAGFRPGLGAPSPPRPIAVFMVRWLLFRIMFESGLVKFTAGDPHWRDLSAMEVMYETSPFPTILAYFDHHLPHLWHLGEILLTMLAELVGPIAAIFGGRRGRWFAFWAWTAFQVGIQLTGNFGWLNTASIGFGLVLLDDQMIAGAIARVRRIWPGKTVSEKIALPASTPAAPLRALPPLRKWGVLAAAALLWMHFACSLFFFAKAAGVDVYRRFPVMGQLMWSISSFRSVKEYSLYATFDPVRYQVEFEGSNDGGRSWRTYRYRFLPQREDEMAGFIAPWFGRFEATVQIEAWVGRKSPVIPVIAARLLDRVPEVMGLFRDDPFPDGPPTFMRMTGYRMTFTDLAAWRSTGRYWEKEPQGDYLAGLYRTPEGVIGQFSLAEGNAALARGDLAGARQIFAQQYAGGFSQAGLRLADMELRGYGGARDPAGAFQIFSALAQHGEVEAEHGLGFCYENGVGVPSDAVEAARYYRRAALRGYVPAMLGLAVLESSDRLPRRDDVEALRWLVSVENSGEKSLAGASATSRMLEFAHGLAAKLRTRMSATQIAEAEKRAAEGR